MNNEQLPLAMSESFWANSHLSIARYTGRVHLGKYDYVICNKDGKDIFECSLEAQKDGYLLARQFCFCVNVERTGTQTICKILYMTGKIAT